MDSKFITKSGHLVTCHCALATQSDGCQSLCRRAGLFPAVLVPTYLGPLPECHAACAEDHSLVQGLRGDATYLVVTDAGEIEKYGINGKPSYVVYAYKLQSLLSCAESGNGPTSEETCLTFLNLGHAFSLKQNASWQNIKKQKMCLK